MSIVELGALGEFVGSVAVVVTLVYLTLQLRQTKQSLRSASLQNAITTMNQNSQQVIQDPQFAELVLDGMFGRELDPPESLRFGLWLTGMFHVFQQHYLDSEKGLGDTRIWEGEERAMRALLGNAGVAKWWREMPSLPFSDDFMGHVNSILGDAKETEGWRGYRLGNGPS